MKFLVDAQLPKRLKYRLQEAGHEALHTSELLPLGQRTPDDQITRIAMREGFVVMTKDADFVDTFLLRREPSRLLLIATGNISTNALESLIVAQLPAIVVAFADHQFVELRRSALIAHV